MLIIQIEMTKPCRAGDNMTGLVQVNTRRVQMSGGDFRTDPVYAGAVAAGLPTGSAYPETPAPIELQPGDVVRLNADYQLPGVVSVRRKGQEIYSV